MHNIPSENKKSVSVFKIQLDISVFPLLALFKLGNPFWGRCENTGDPVPTPQNAVSDQDLHCLLIHISMQNTIP